MKQYPFKDPGVSHFIIEKHRRMFDEIRSEVMGRTKGSAIVRDGRVGFGTVAAVGPVWRSGLALSMWKWRHADPAEYPEWMGATEFVDDPLGVPPETSLGTRMILAEQFAEVASRMFDPEDVGFTTRAIEIVAATPDRPPGIERGEDVDLLAIELYEGVPMPKIIDRLVQIEVDIDRGWFSYGGFWLQVQIWHRAERVNAARALLGKDLLPIRLPGLKALERRADLLMDAKRERSQGQCGGGPATTT
ncbi:hypothetical protein ACFSC3_08005 [Sphingomonas floccifaciens]|uniref:DUF4304 domain-containing protein n=1 Tax=Sphingomonas floccifaciens TaxID=1844115 RepID=A0ABW4NBI6_9SPHN